MSIRRLAATMLCATALAAPAFALDRTVETEHGPVRITTIAENLLFPWGLVFLPDGSMLVTEREGTLRHVSAEGALSEPIAGVPPVDARGQGGLLDVALDPDFEANGLVYLSYAEPGEGGANSTAVARGVLDDSRTALGGVEVIFSQRPKLPSQQHFGSRLVFDDGGHLFVTTGDRSAAEYRIQAQDLDSHLGKVIRIHPDGTVPDDNPFVDVAGALPEIYSWGHRNMQGAALHPETGRLWVNEHGPRGGDELNLVTAGGNYGWPFVTEGTEYSGAPIDPPPDLPDDLIPPVRSWTPSPAFSGFAFYTGDRFPAWRGNALMGALAGTSLVRVELDGDAVAHEEFLLTELGLRIRDVRQGPDEAVYLLVDGAEGAILRLTPQ